MLARKSNNCRTAWGRRRRPAAGTFVAGLGKRGLGSQTAATTFRDRNTRIRWRNQLAAADVSFVGKINAGRGPNAGQMPIRQRAEIENQLAEGRSE